MSEGMEVSEEIHDLMDEHLACCKCRDASIKSMFRAKRAIYYGKKGEKALRKFWSMVGDLYPELRGKPCSYSHMDRMVHKSDDPIS